MNKGQAEQNAEAVQLIHDFNEALNRRDLDGMMRRMSADCVFENTYPPPDGTRYGGQDEVRAFWERFFSGASEVNIEVEQLFGQDGRYTMLWVYRWTDNHGKSGRIRGVDVYTLQNGLISAKLSYVKG